MDGYGWNLLILFISEPHQKFSHPQPKPRPISRNFFNQIMGAKNISANAGIHLTIVIQCTFKQLLMTSHFGQWRFENISRQTFWAFTDFHFSQDFHKFQLIISQLKHSGTART